MWTDDVRADGVRRADSSAIAAELPGGRAPRVITLGIETSCDETAVAVVEDGFTVRANLIASQVHLHERFGGVVPEVAARAHVEALNPLLEEALEAAGVRVRRPRRRRGHGRARAWSARCWSAWRRPRPSRSPPAPPLIGVNHLEGHIWANFLEHGPPEPPYVALVVSGGHTMLVHMPERAPPRGAGADARRRGGGGVRQGGAADRPRVPRRARARRAWRATGTPTRSASRARWRTPATTTSR